MMFFRHWLDEDARIGKELEDKGLLKQCDNKKSFKPPFVTLVSAKVDNLDEVSVSLDFEKDGFVYVNGNFGEKVVIEIRDKKLYMVGIAGLTCLWRNGNTQ